MTNHKQVCWQIRWSSTCLQTKSNELAKAGRTVRKHKLPYFTAPSLDQTIITFNSCVVEAVYILMVFVLQFYSYSFSYKLAVSNLQRSAHKLRDRLWMMRTFSREPIGQWAPLWVYLLSWTQPALEQRAVLQSKLAFFTGADSTKPKVRDGEHHDGGSELLCAFCFL